MGEHLKKTQDSPENWRESGSQVTARSVSRWFAEGEFERESQRYASWFDENGSLRPLLRRK